MGKCFILQCTFSLAFLLSSVDFNRAMLASQWKCNLSQWLLYNDDSVITIFIAAHKKIITNIKRYTFQYGHSIIACLNCLLLDTYLILIFFNCNAAFSINGQWTFVIIFWFIYTLKLFFSYYKFTSGNEEFYYSKIKDEIEIIADLL